MQELGLFVHGVADAHHASGAHGPQRQDTLPLLGDTAKIAVAAAFARHLAVNNLQGKGIAGGTLQLPAGCLQLSHGRTGRHGAASQCQRGQQSQFLVHGFTS